MKKKILTVDDSKSIRIIVKKAFKNHDVDIYEAENGIEGLKKAEDCMPDLILLDVTMPEMNGIDMLKELKSNIKLKKIPVIMLTAEGSKDVVIKIAKLGIRDYIVKPFNENVLIDKVHRVLSLDPKVIISRVSNKSIKDPLRIVVIETKPAIIEQLQSAFSNFPWTIAPAASTTEALDLFKDVQAPDLAVVSLSLSDDDPFAFVSSLRSIPFHVNTPVFGLVLKTDQNSQEKAKKAGYTDFFTKPLNLDSLCDPIVHALKLDMSTDFFQIEKNNLIIKMPSCSSDAKLQIIKDKLEQEIANAAENGLTCILFDLENMETITVEGVKILIMGANLCEELTLNYIFVANDEIMQSLKNSFQETVNWKFVQNNDEIKI